MYKIVIVGHGSFPSGIKGAVDFIIGSNDNVIALDLNNVRTHEVFERELKEILDTEERVIILADLTGGAPHQISSRLILESGKKDQHVISGINLSLAIDIAATVCASDIGKEEINDILVTAVNDAKSMMVLINNNTFTADEAESDSGDFI